MSCCSDTEIQPLRLSGLLRHWTQLQAGRCVQKPGEPPRSIFCHTRAEECSTCAIAVWVRSQFSFKSAMIRPASSSCLNNNCWKIGKQLVGNICLLKYSIETFSVRVSVRASAKKPLVCIGLKSKKLVATNIVFGIVFGLVIRNSCQIYSENCFSSFLFFETFSVRNSVRISVRVSAKQLLVCIG